jgi:hypothetical protein
MTRDCFELGSGFLLVGSPVACSTGFAAGAAVADDTIARFFAGFDMEILHSVDGGVAPHHRSPTSATKPAGQDL